jgi:TadE-like protein
MIWDHFRKNKGDHKRGQAFLELALILPVLLIMLVGMVEVVFFIGRYLDVLDLTREAARFASQRDPQIKEILAGAGIPPGDTDCSTPNQFNFFYDTACVFSPTIGSTSCWDADFCNGLNPFMLLNPASDDVVVSVFTISHNQVTNVWPIDDPNGDGKYWALSNHDNYTDPEPSLDGDNWTRDCQGNVVRNTPHYTATSVSNQLLAYGPNVPDAKGYVAVEFFYCYNQVLNLPMITQFIPNPFQIHAYTIMPLPPGSPTPTPSPSP